MDAVSRGIRMKIVKQFDDPDFINRISRDKSGYWRWGLGDDGKVYCQASYFVSPNEWFRLGYSPMAMDKMCVKDMVRIVKEFGHLLVWL